MGKQRGKKRAREPEAADIKAEEEQAGPSEMTDLERERAMIIARNRERLLALGIPSLVKELERQAGGPAAAKRQQQKKQKGGGEYKPRAKREPGAPEQPTRRSRRLQDAVEHPKPKPETAEERFERELGEFVVEGACPRCGKEMERGHKAHLQACGGARPPRQPRPNDAEELAELTEEERKDVYQRTLARMKKVHLDGLMDLTADAAKFAVFGSTGSHYTITLKDDKHACTCLDYRFRRHHCKHILAVLDSLQILERPEGWRAAVEGRMDELVAEMRARRAQEAPPPPPDKAAAVGLKFV